MIISITKKGMTLAITTVLSWLRYPVAIIIAAFIISPRFWEFWGSAHIDYGLLLEYFRVGVWPMVALTVFIGTKRYIPRFLDNVEELAFGKFKTKMRKPTNEVTSSDVEGIKGSEDAVKPAESGDPTPEELDTLTTPEAEQAFQNIYDGMYGSQLMVVKRLLNHIPNGLPEEGLMDLYEAHKQSKRDAYPSFKHFIQFLLDTSIVIYENEAKCYRITYAGVYFLKYLTDNGDFYKTPNF